VALHKKLDPLMDSGIRRIRNRACESYDRLAAAAKQVSEEMDNPDVTHGIPVWPLDDEDSLIISVEQAVSRHKSITEPPPIVLDPESKVKGNKHE